MPPGIGYPGRPGKEALKSRRKRGDKKATPEVVPVSSSAPATVKGGRPFGRLVKRIRTRRRSRRASK